MNKKYLILKKKIPKAQTGDKMSWGSGLFNHGWVRPSVKQNLINNQFPTTYGQMTVGSPEQINTLNSATSTGTELSNEKSNKINAGIGLGLQVANVGSNFLFDNATKNNSKTDGFGNEIYDNKDANLEIGKTAMSGAIKGAQLGLSTGNPFIAAGGFIAGGIAGLIGGKKKVNANKALYATNLDNNIMQAGRSEDLRNSRMITAKSGIKLEKTNLGKFFIPKTKSTTLVLKNGGRIETPGEVNIVVRGKLHKENNNLGNKDKGIPVVDSNGVKEYEVEAGEIIFRQEITLQIEKFAKEYKETNNENLPEELGKILTKELLKNTQDNHGTFGVKIKD